jgi:5-(carboxyamino)imidazole ribonucleotide mutase
MPLVSVIMGSRSDYEHMSAAVETLKEFGVDVEQRIVSAHRTPQFMYDYASGAAKRGVEIIIAGAGGAAHLPGMVASITHLPVIGVPVPSKHLKGLDSLLSIVQMPAGIPVAAVAIGNSRNAALLALRILGVKHRDIAEKMISFMKKQTAEVLNEKLD